MQVLLPNHLILLELKLSLRYKQLIVLILELLVELVYLCRLLLQVPQNVLRLNDGSAGSRRDTAILLLSCLLLNIRSSSVSSGYLQRWSENWSHLVNRYEATLTISDELGRRGLISVHNWAIKDRIIGNDLVILLRNAMLRHMDRADLDRRLLRVIMVLRVRVLLPGCVIPRLPRIPVVLYLTRRDLSLFR